jgi:hypothetical protein
VTPCRTKFGAVFEDNQRDPKDRDAVRRIEMELKDDLAKRVQDSYRKIPAVAESLNSVSDSLNSSAKRVEAILKKHPLGVASWVKFTDSRSPDGECYHYEQVGFAKINGKWSLAIRTVDGDVRDDDDIESWPFNEAPRGLRVKAVNKLPDLLEQLVKDGNEMIQEVTGQVKAVDFLADALEAVLEPEAENTTDKPPARLPLRPVRGEKGDAKK